MSQRAVKESLCKLNQDSWLVADQVLITRTAVTPPQSTSWPDGNGAFFFLSRPDFETDPLAAQPVNVNGSLPLVYAPGRTHAVWRIGEAFLKVTIPVTPHGTGEDVTINKLKEARLSFEIPRVLFHSKSGDRSYLIVSQVPGTTVSSLWPSLDAAQRRHCASRVAQAILELVQTMPRNQRISGIDGNHLSDLFLTPRGQQDTDVSPETLLTTVKEVGMAETDFLFYHCDIGPGNVLFTKDLQHMGVIDWETAGFVPHEWLRTKLIISRGFDLDLPGENSNEEVREYANLEERCLAEKGYGEVADCFRRYLKGIAD